MAMPVKVASAPQEPLQPYPPSLTIAQLAAMQSRQLQADLNKRASVNTKSDATSQVSVPATVGPVTPRGLSKTADSYVVVVLATYGTPTASRAELQVNGITRLVSANTRLGPVTVNTITADQVELTVLHKGKPFTRSLTPGERMELTLNPISK